MIDFFFKGGPLMYPILLCSILTVAFGIERFWHYFKVGRRSEVPEQIHALIENGEYDRALALAREAPSPVTSILAEGLQHRGLERGLIEEVISLKGASELNSLNKNLHILELIGRIAPLLGLLGTVLGMVVAFRQVASARGAVDPSLLAGGIWEALITTVAGLCVAIPAMVLHHFFEDKVNSFAYFMKHYGSEASKHLGAKG